MERETTSSAYPARQTGIGRRQGPILIRVRGLAASGRCLQETFTTAETQPEANRVLVAKL
jgi:hypothetical protein